MFALCEWRCPFDCLSWLHSYECPWDEETLVMAAAGGHTDVLRYVHREGLQVPSSKAYAAAAAEGGHRVVGEPLLSKHTAKKIAKRKKKLTKTFQPFDWLLNESLRVPSQPTRSPNTLSNTLCKHS